MSRPSLIMSKGNPNRDRKVVDNISPSRYIPHVALNGNDSPSISAQYLGEKGILFQANCLDLLANMRQGTVDLVFADPPLQFGETLRRPRRQ